jgi:VIT1/CCC1 family predicted Fe2+/Mn2+ transporter
MNASPTADPGAEAGAPRPRRPLGWVLNPIDRCSEILFALIMVLAITCSFSVAESKREDVGTMLIGAVGCNVAWGIVDAVMYLMAGLTERARGLRMLRELRGISDPAESQRVIAEALPEVARSALRPADLELIRTRLAELPDLLPGVRLTMVDWLGALAVFLCVFLSTFPVVIPFLLVEDATKGLRISNAIAVIMLYITGHSLGSYAGGRPWVTGLAMVLLGAALVAATIALGG